MTIEIDPSHRIPENNPVPILDPSRKSGLIPDHPFVAALYERALTLLRPLVEEERTREQRERARTVESRKTRKRLDALERAANQFMDDYSDEEMSRDPKRKERGSQFQIRGYSLSPQYAQVVREQSLKCWLTVRSKAFPEIGEGELVEVECLTDDIRAERPNVPLQPVEAQEGALRATWSVKALTETSATGLEARVGPPSWAPSSAKPIGEPRETSPLSQSGSPPTTTRVTISRDLELPIPSVVQSRQSGGPGSSSRRRGDG